MTSADLRNRDLTTSRASRHGLRKALSLFYIRSEYQHSPSAPALPLAAREAITLDFARSIVPPPFPVPPDTPIQSIDRGRLLDAYVAMNLSDWQLSYGKQSLWWGPNEGGGVMISDNADPMLMFRINRVTPFKLPWIFGYLGPMRVEFFVGQYAGYQFMFTPSGLVGQFGQSLHPQPILHGERFSFKPTPNFEFGMSRTTDYGGPGYPLTVHTFLRSVFSTDETIPGAANKPGSRRSGLDFNYRIRNGLTFYADGMTEHDSISPIVDPDVAAWLGGIYILACQRFRRWTSGWRAFTPIRLLAATWALAFFTTTLHGSLVIPIQAI